MHDPPPEVYEKWPAPNYTDPVTRGSTLVVVDVTMCAVSSLIVLARCYTRVRITGSFGLDDVFICFALLPSIALTAVTTVGENVFGWNRHVWDVTADQMRGGLMMEWASGLLYIIASLLTKLSIVFFCRRLLSESHSIWYRRGLDLFAVATFIGNLAYIVTFCFACQPLSAYWDFVPPTYRPDREYHCIDIGQLFLSGGILNVSWDFLTWLVPLPIVLQLQLPLRQRVMVMALFALGLLVVAVSVVKTIFIQLAFNETYDVTWSIFPLWITLAVEIDVGIICASVPALRPLFSHFLPRPPMGRWAARMSYARMSEDDGSPEGGTPMSPLSPVRSHSKMDEMKPWSRGRATRNSVGKIDKAVTSPTGSAPMSGRSSRRLTPLTEMVAPGLDADGAVRFNQTQALPPPAEDEAWADLAEPEKAFRPASQQPVNRTALRQPFLNATTKLPPLDTGVRKAKSTKSPDTPSSSRKHSRKTSAATEFDGFNFAMPPTSSRRASESTAPPSYGDFVSQNSFIMPEESVEGNHEAFRKAHMGQAK